MNRLFRFAAASLIFLPTLTFAQTPTAAEEGGDGKSKKDRDPANVSVADPGDIALKKFVVAPGLKVDLWAEEPLIENVVAFAFDEKGRAFVVETHRRRTSDPDIRKNTDWLDDSLAMRTVEDRINFLKKTLDPALKLKPTKDHADINGDGQFDYHDWEIESEDIKLVEDANNTGKADTANIFATDFHTLETTTAAGVAVRGDDVWFACVPNLWRFHGAKEGKATSREQLATGFGVHIAYGGHDMHGTKIGPDGRLYWTIADTGTHATTKDGKILDNPDSGSVFRCDPDGSNMEIFATGLRNPQSLAFNDLGDLFTGDNNADGGDKARWTHVVEGGDYGWRIGWQFLPKLGPWNSEGMWHLDNNPTNLQLLPPVGLIGHGPAGIAHYPGTGLPDRYADHFFYADFPGGVRSFALKPKGASYTVDNPNDVLQDNKPAQMTGKLLWNLYPSDVQFSTNGGVYVLDWVYGWDKTAKGRIFRVHDPEVDASPLVQETKRLLAEGVGKFSTEELVNTLAHADQRLRMAAQFELVKRGELDALVQAALQEKNPLLMRLHAIWGISQHARHHHDREIAKSLVALAKDKEPEVRAQWAKYVGETGSKSEVDLVIRLLADSEPRVRFFAAQALGKLGFKEAVPALIAQRELNNDSDPFVRHAVVTSLAVLADEATLLKAATNESKAVRTVALLTLARQHSPQVALFLHDKVPQLVLEAARAIHDGPIPAALRQLAALAEKPGLAEPLSRRAIDANFLIGTPEAARRLTKIAGSTKVPEAVRLDALDALADWNEPFHRDRVNGLWHPLPPSRNAEAPVASAAKIIPALLREPSEKMRLAAAGMAGDLHVTASQDFLLALVGDHSLGGKTRAAALRALGTMESAKLADGIKIAVADTDKPLLAAARELAVKVSPADAVTLNAPVLDDGTLREKQAALATIGSLQVPAADKVLLAELDKLDANKLPAGLSLDLMEAAAKRNNAEIKRRVAAREDKFAQSKDPLAKWRDCMEGGNAKHGHEVFAEKAEAACMRCHKFKGVGGDVGPDLAKISKPGDRNYILESIVDPNAKIAPGYDSVLLTLNSGDVVLGILNAETPDELTITNIADGKKQTIKTSDIKERTHAPSPMPPGLADVLGKRDLRDVVEFLATGKTKETP
ncbi:heme-binding protein [Chthoniobacter flavus Ellin428]|uniref:Heme-binding protein n=1 Tax=Chthoniobacter flavus Ellin428 TaxID=497964 RepID=B4DB84_9BACT|nr:HEAT repeat domain-containing protein [Chthoniobacter flavus]EDY16272.1 heme-binding protein [Chthoniobacter flavus Ellin428]TCO84729.1 putative membrane-bound dehydrogenase-like protein [Chthoniobacter flavus]